MLFEGRRGSVLLVGPGNGTAATVASTVAGTLDGTLASTLAGTLAGAFAGTLAGTFGNVFFGVDTLGFGAESDFVFLGFVSNGASHGASLRLPVMRLLLTPQPRPRAGGRPRPRTPLANFPRRRASFSRRSVFRSALSLSFDSFSLAFAVCF